MAACLPALPCHRQKIPTNPSQALCSPSWQRCLHGCDKNWHPNSFHAGHHISAGDRSKRWVSPTIAGLGRLPITELGWEILWMILPRPVYSSTLGNFPHFSCLLKQRHADQTQAMFAEVQAAAQHAWDAQGHPLTPLLSRHCTSGTWGLQSSWGVDTTGPCLVTMGLTFSGAEDLSACFIPAEPRIDALSWSLPKSPLRATCTLQPRCSRLLHIFSLIEGRGEFSFCADSLF